MGSVAPMGNDVQKTLEESNYKLVVLFRGENKTPWVGMRARLDARK